jgi:peptide-methionine (S)-S-oxide reductase
VVQITFDPSVLPYRELLEIFFAFHDPTTLNRQGNDVGTQYRSAIYYHSPAQERTAREVIDRLQRDGTWDDAIVTEVTARRSWRRRWRSFAGSMRGGCGRLSS